MSEDGKLVCELGVESMRKELDYSRLLGGQAPVGLEGVQLLVNEEDADKAFDFIDKLQK